MQPRRHSRNGLWILWVWMLVLGCLLVGAARADGVGADCVRQGSVSGNLVYQYFPNATILLPNSTPVGNAIGPWIISNHALAWRCTPRELLASGIRLQLSVQGYPPYVRDGFITVDGGTYGVYQTNNATLGYIARWRFSANGEVSDWYPLTVAPGNYQTPPNWFDISYNGGASFNLGVDVAIRFVKRTSSLVPGAVTIVDPMYMRHYQQTSDGNTSAGTNTYRIAQVRSSTMYVVAGGTCTTPNKDVELVTVPASSFTGIGSTAATQPFSLLLANCPSRMNSIGYSFAPTTAVLDEANGVVALDDTSTARGVGIQLTDSNNRPIKFGTVYILEEYNWVSARDYHVELEASLYQTETHMSGGSVSSAVTFTMDYR